MQARPPIVSGFRNVMRGKVVLACPRIPDFSKLELGLLSGGADRGEGEAMKRSRFSEEKIAYALRLPSGPRRVRVRGVTRAGVGQPLTIADICASQFDVGFGPQSRSARDFA